MSAVFRLDYGKDERLADEANRALKEAGIAIRTVPRMRGAPSMDVVVALSSAGVFTALYQVICKVLERNKDREVTIERKGVRVTLKGCSIPHVKELLAQVAPELLPRKSKTTK
jgi:hypothetical protein